MAIEPVLHRILVEPETVDNYSTDRKKLKALGFELPPEQERAQASVDTGTVVAIGPTAFRDFGASSPLAIGDKIVYAKFAGKFVMDPYTEQQLVAINDEDVICIFREEKE